MPEHQSSQHDETDTTARARDDRRGAVDPAHSPVPSSPQADGEDVRRTEEKLERVITK